jgi:hypothetical protein
VCGRAIEGARCGPRPNASPPVHPGRKKFGAHIQFITSGPTVLGAGPRWADQLNRSNETTKTTPQITTIFSASTSISVPDARERTFATAFIATSKFGLLMRQPECLLSKPARGACELAHNRGLILSKMPPAEVRASQRAAPFMLQTRSVCASLVGVLQNAPPPAQRYTENKLGRGLRADRVKEWKRLPDNIRRTSRHRSPQHAREGDEGREDDPDDSDEGNGAVNVRHDGHRIPRNEKAAGSMSSGPFGSKLCIGERRG